jgi:hypothetical protein
MYSEKIELHDKLLLHYQTGLEMDKEAIFPPSGHYRSQEFHHSHLLWFKMITPTIQTSSAERPNTKGTKDTLTSDHITRKTSPQT